LIPAKVNPDDFAKKYLGRLRGLKEVIESFGNDPP
jgi:hypothetical protein